MRASVNSPPATPRTKEATREPRWFRGTGFLDRCATQGSSTCQRHVWHFPSPHQRLNWRKDLAPITVRGPSDRMTRRQSLSNRVWSVSGTRPPSGNASCRLRVKPVSYATSLSHEKRGESGGARNQQPSYEQGSATVPVCRDRGMKVIGCGKPPLTCHISAHPSSFFFWRGGGGEYDV